MVDNLSLPKILNITNKLKHVIHNGVGEKFCEPHVNFRQVAFVSVSYDFLESAPLPRDIRLCLCCEQHEHVSKHCTDCPRLLSFSQTRASLTVYNSVLLPLPLLFDFHCMALSIPNAQWVWRLKTKLSCVGKRFDQHTVRSLRSRRCGFTARASRTYVFRFSSPHTAELMPE